jgi:hypothetical protein
MKTNSLTLFEFVLTIKKNATSNLIVELKKGTIAYNPYMIWGGWGMMGEGARRIH